MSINPSDARLLSQRYKAKSEALARNRTLRVHGTRLAFRPINRCFPKSRIMLLIPMSLSITKFPTEQRVDQDGMI